MPTLIKGIISPVTDPLLTLTAAGANDQPAECSHALCPIVFPSGVTVVASQSFPADPASDLRQLQSMPINSTGSRFHTPPPPPPSHVFSGTTGNGAAVFAAEEAALN